MTARPGSLSVDALGAWHVGVGVVWWRVGTVAAGSDPGLASRQWVENIVREHNLFRWRGFAPREAGRKPRFAGRTRADFNISHSGDVVAVAVASNGQVGVDIERAPFDAFASPALRRRMLTEAERAVADACETDDARARYLARIWTAKEAVVKATGQGLRRDFRSFDAPISPDAATTPPYEACIALVDTDDTTHHLRLVPLAHRPDPGDDPWP